MREFFLFLFIAKISSTEGESSLSNKRWRNFLRGKGVKNKRGNVLEIVNIQDSENYSVSLKTKRGKFSLFLWNLRISKSKLNLPEKTWSDKCWVSIGGANTGEVSGPKSLRWKTQKENPILQRLSEGNFYIFLGCENFSKKALGSPTKKRGKISSGLRNQNIEEKSKTTQVETDCWLKASSLRKVENFLHTFV